MALQFDFVLLQAVANDTVNTQFSFGTPIIFTISCLLVLFIASRAIECPHVGPKMPLGPLEGIFNKMSVATFIGAMSFGHIIAAIVTLVTRQAV